MKSRIILPLVGIVSALILAAVIVFRPLPTTITRENATKIKTGMTYAQVVDILGESRDEVTGTEIPRLGDLISPWGVTLAGWRGETAHVRIRFEKARVAKVTVTDTEFPTGEYLQWRVRKSLGLSIELPDEPWGEEPVK